MGRKEIMMFCLFVLSSKVLSDLWDLVKRSFGALFFLAFSGACFFVTCLEVNFCFDASSGRL